MLRPVSHCSRLTWDGLLEYSGPMFWVFTCFATSSPLSTRPAGCQPLLEESEALQGPNPERAHLRRVLYQRAGGHCSHTPDFEFIKQDLWAQMLRWRSDRVPEAAEATPTY